MNILLVNKYLYERGGDAITTLSCGKLLSTRGHRILFWGMNHPRNPEYSNKDVFVSYVDLNDTVGVSEKIKIALNILYSLEAKKKIEQLINRRKPDVAHLNNFAHQISPSIIDVLYKNRIPVVMTLHDFKLVCASYLLVNRGRICELCKKRSYYHCFLQKCVKNSRAKSLINTAEMYLHHRFLHIYNKIEIFISPSKFLRDKYKDMGFNRAIECLPNFVNLNEYEYTRNSNRNIFVYFGRLSSEKGVELMLEAVKGLRIHLKIIGDGPLKKPLKQKVVAERIKEISFEDHKDGPDLKREISRSLAVILPSICYENSPRSVLEAFALGRPVIGAHIGGIPELVKDHYNGLTFEPTNVHDLRAKIIYLINNKNEAIAMGRNARAFIEEHHNSDQYYKRLINIYNKAIGRKKWKLQL